MMPALRVDARPSDVLREPTVSLDHYVLVGKLRGNGRAEVAICLPKGACSARDVVVMKTFPTLGVAFEARGLEPRSAADGSGADFPDELQIASSIRHANIVRTLGVGVDDGRPFVVNEYLEGTTLRRLLRGLVARSQRLSNPAIGRILLAILSAVEHADQLAKTPGTRALARQTILADDVYVTFDGDVKLLGFKPSGRHPMLHEAGVGAGLAAVDALLATQGTPELSAWLVRIGRRISARSSIGLWQVACSLQAWQTDKLRSDGRAELAAAMSLVAPELRATRRAQIEAACTRVLGGRGLDVDMSREPSEEPPPVSGRRRITGRWRIAAAERSS